jgi:antitoxin ParD1/3/4
MNVSLTPELETLVHGKVESGLYTSASEVVREALRLLNDRDTIQQQRLAEMRREIAFGLDQLNRGEGIAHDDESLKAMFDEIKREGRKLIVRSQKDAE